MMAAFTGRIAVVTGAGSGVGRAIALALAADGATVCLVGRRAEALEATAQEIEGSAPRPLIYAADLARDEDIERLAARLRADHGRVDTLVHGAGAYARGEAAVAPAADFDRQYRVNVRAPYALTGAVLPLLKPYQGQIVFINSSAGLSAGAGVGQYAATKHALRAVADSVRAEVNADGVRVLSVYLGRTATPMQEMVHALEGKAYHPARLIQPEDVAAVVVHTLNLPYTVEVTDIMLRPLLKG